MTLFLASPLRRALAAAALAFAAMLVVLAVVHSNPSPGVAPGGNAVVRRDAGSTASEIRRLQAEVRSAPSASGEAALAMAYLQRARETGDPAWHVRADGLVRRALARDGGRSAPAHVVAGTLAASRHDFGAALAHARRAQALAPESVAAFPVLVDALVELGRYGAAERALQAMIDAKPTLGGYARVSYFRELHGDLRGAAEAMRLAVSAGGGAGESTASVQAMLGDVELAQGRVGSAARAYAEAARLVPGFPAARAGEARLAAAVGDARLAASRWRALVEVRPLAEYAQALGEAELALGRRREAARAFELVRVQQALLARAGTDLDAELALFEADHGSPRRAVALARRAWDAAPSVRSADALGWALTRAGRPRSGLVWARRALRLGSLDAACRYHAGLAARAAGRPAEARRHLRLALRHGLAAWPLRADRARRALRPTR